MFYEQLKRTLKKKLGTKWSSYNRLETKILKVGIKTITEEQIKEHQTLLCKILTIRS